MRSFDMYESSLWVKLTPSGFERLKSYCDTLNEELKKGCGESVPEAVEDFRRQDDWFEFNPAELCVIFAPIVKDYENIPFVNNKVFTEKPY